jgi:hypothetical protein
MIAPDADRHALIKRFGIVGRVELAGALVMDRSRHLIVRRAGNHDQGCGDQNGEALHEALLPISDMVALRRIPMMPVGDILPDKIAPAR